jgi:coproporphyrinogen III oxidase-like Fe-S oxidoreductase
MTDPELVERLSLVRAVLERTDDPLAAPFGIEYGPMSGDEHRRAWEAFTPGAPGFHEAAALYVHIPFCARVCSYCLLSSSKTPGKDHVDAYVRALRRHAAELAPAVGSLRFSSLHVGGGTPTLLNEKQLDELLADLAKFPRAEKFQIGIEAHPATTTLGKLEVMRRHDVDRVSFGVETFSPEVLAAVNRADQTTERVVAAIDAARRCGLSVNVDLLAGLPGETCESFAASVRRALELEPDSMSVNRFLAENSPLAESGYSAREEDIANGDRMLVEADRIIHETRPPRWPDRPLAAAGYGTQYVWDRTDKARSYFQQDMIGAASTLALGHGGMGHLPGRFYAVAAGDVRDYTSALEAGRLPPMLVSPVTTRFEMAFFIVDRACRGALSPRDFASVFEADARKVFGRELAFLVASGLLRQVDGRLSKPPRRDFQATELLAFLALDNGALARSLAELDSDAPKPRAALRDYRLVSEELPPSLLWCRMAIRASRAARGLNRPRRLDTVRA